MFGKMFKNSCLLCNKNKAAKQKFKFKATECFKITVKVAIKSNKLNGKMHRILNVYAIVIF